MSDSDIGEILKPVTIPDAPVAVGSLNKVPSTVLHRVSQSSTVLPQSAIMREHHPPLPPVPARTTSTRTRRQRNIPKQTARERFGSIMPASTAISSANIRDIVNKRTVRKSWLKAAIANLMRQVDLHKPEYLETVKRAPNTLRRYIDASDEDEVIPAVMMDLENTITHQYAALTDGIRKTLETNPSISNDDLWAKIRQLIPYYPHDTHVSGFGKF